MATGGRIAARILQTLASEVKPGMSTGEIDIRARELIREAGVKPAFLGYNNFPAVICVSINDEVVHGIPSPKRILNEGDIVGLDFGIVYDGWNLDTAVSIFVPRSGADYGAERAGLARKASQSEAESSEPPRRGGENEREASRIKIQNELRNPLEDTTPGTDKVLELIEVTKQALDIGIAQAQIGNHVGAIGHAIQTYVEQYGFGVVRDLVGHGIGRKLHEAPPVPNFGSPTEGPILKEGMVIAIEPMINAGDWRVTLDADNWTYLTKDGSLSAHFEHTIAITKEGPQILTIL